MSVANDYSTYNRLDRVTGAAQALTVDHALIHEGRGVSIDTRDVALVNAAHLSIAIKSPPNRYVHLKHYEVFFGGNYGLFTVLEGCTIAGGSSAGRNRNRATATSLNTSIFTGVTISGGTEIEGLIVTGGAGVAQASFAGSRSLDIEWVLKPATQYALKLLNSSGGNAVAYLWAFMYEEDDG